LACGPDYGVVRLFDVATGQERATLKHDGTAHSVLFSPDGKLLASRDGGAAKLWDLGTGNVRTIIQAGDGLDVYCVSFSPDGWTLAIVMGSREFGGAHGEVNLWDARLGRVQAVLQGEMGKVRSLAFAPAGKALVTGSGEIVILWDLSSAISDGAWDGAAKPFGWGLVCPKNTTIKAVPTKWPCGIPGPSRRPPSAASPGPCFS
jgi:WD40 repeat protein